MRRILVLAASLFLFALTASAQLGTWTSVGSVGTIDETSAPPAFTQSRLGYATGVLNPIVARYNVTNTYGGFNNDIVPWIKLEVGARNTSPGLLGATVRAKLYEVDPCTGIQTQICEAVNDNAGSTGSCAYCSWETTSTRLDFGNKLYYVEVTISRSAGSQTPELTTLRIF